MDINVIFRISFFLYSFHIPIFCLYVSHLWFLAWQSDLDEFELIAVLPILWCFNFSLPSVKRYEKRVPYLDLLGIS